jgi:hypothetical protein
MRLKTFFLLSALAFGGATLPALAKERAPRDDGKAGKVEYDAAEQKCVTKCQEPMVKCVKRCGQQSACLADCSKDMGKCMSGCSSDPID